MNILAVDDEPIMQNSYLNLFDWKGKGFNFLGVAHNAFNALDIVRSSHVDVVITDIRMPKMSGIDLIREVKKDYPHIKFIVMSGYDDFSLVREAFVLGAKQYFLKDEIEPDIILEALLDLKNEFEKENNDIEKTSNSVRSEDQEYKNLHAERLIKKLVWGFKPQETEEQLKRYGIYLNHDKLSIVVITMVDYHMIESKVWDKESETFKYAIMNVLNEICEKFNGVYPVYNLPGECFILTSSTSSVDIYKLCNEIGDSFQKCFGMICNFGCSEVRSKNDNLGNVYQEAKNACEFCFVIGNGNVAEYKKIEFSGEKLDVSYYAQEIKKIFFSYTDVNRIRENVIKLRIPRERICYTQIEEVRNLFYLYYMEIVNFIKEQDLINVSFETIYSFDKLKKSADLSELNRWLTLSVDELVNVSSSFSKVNRAKQYIKQNYSKQLTLNMVATELGISEGHLSRIFQQSVGCSFSNFLMTTRIEAAKKLMATTNLKIYEIAQQVGYTSIEQFSKTFKKIVGVSPKSYME